MLLKASRNPEILFDVLTSLSSLPSIEVQNRLAEIGLDDSLEVNLRVKALETLNSQVNQTENGVRPETVRRLQEFLQEGSLDEKLRSATRTLMGSLQPMGPGLKTNSR